jgi:hypothetical protein
VREVRVRESAGKQKHGDHAAAATTRAPVVEARVRVLTGNQRHDHHAAAAATRAPMETSEGVSHALRL